MKLNTLLLIVAIIATSCGFETAIAQTDSDTETTAESETTNDNSALRIDSSLLNDVRTGRQDIEARTNLRGGVDTSSPEIFNRLRNIDQPTQVDFETRAEVHQEVIVDRQDAREQNVMERREAATERQETQSERRAETTAERRARRQQIQERRAELRENRENKRDEIRSRVGERLELNQERRAENRARFSARAQQRVEAAADRLNNAYQSRLNHAESIYAKVESRIAALESTGADVSGTTSIMAEARNILDAAVENTIEATVTTDIILEADDARALWDEAKAEFQAAKDDYVRLKELYRQVIEELKAAAGELQADVSVDISAEAAVEN